MAVAVRIHVERSPTLTAVDDVRADSFAEMYERWHDAVVVYCARILKGAADPEEVAQEAFLRAWSSRERFSPSRPFWPWLATIARHVCIDEMRRDDCRRDPRRTSVTRSQLPAYDPQEIIDTDQDLVLALEALGALPAVQQRIVRRRDLDGLSYERIASLEGVSIESVRATLRRARASLRDGYFRLTNGAPAAVLLAYKRLRQQVLGWRRHVPGNADALAATGTPLGEILGVVLALGVATVIGPGVPLGDHAGTNRSGVGSSVVTAASAVSSPGGATMSPAFSPRAAAERDTSRPADGSAASTYAPPDATSLPLPVEPPIETYEADHPDELNVSQVVAVPGSGGAHLFASGRPKTSCTAQAQLCWVIFESTDGGGTWTPREARGFVGGELLVPPDFQTRPRLFAAHAASLSVSTDRGASFTGVRPVGGPAAMSPNFAVDRRILVGGGFGWDYNDATGTVQPFGRIAAAGPMRSFAFRGDAILMGALVADGDAPERAAVFVCAATTCSGPAILPGGVGTPKVKVSPADPNLVLAWTPTRLYRSTDGGENFAPVPIPASNIRAFTFTPSGTAAVALARQNADVPVPGVMTSTDAGATWVAAGAHPRLQRGASAIAAITSNRLIAAAEIGGGVVCSSTNGATWVTCGGLS